MTFGLLLTLLHVSVFAEMIDITTQSVQKYYDRNQPQTCFQPEIISTLSEQSITCVWSHPGAYPAQEVRAEAGTFLCCFKEVPSSGVFWAIGESVMSRVHRIDVDKTTGWVIPGRHEQSRLYVFPMESVQLLDIHALDSRTDEPIKNAHVTMSNDIVHLVSYQKVTDSDGYAVVPVIDGQKYIVTVRANGYLPAKPFSVSTKDIIQPPLMMQNSEEITEDEELPSFNEAERVVELDPGIVLKGKVTDFHHQPVEGARLHVEVERSDHSIWSSDLDQPRPVSYLASINQHTWFPKRSEFQTSTTGQFYIETIPQGKIRIFATHDHMPPSRIVTVDATDRLEIDTLSLQMQEPRKAWIRVQNTHGVAISSSLTIIDENTGFEMETLETPTSGAIERKNLPEKVRFRILVEDVLPYEVVKNLSGNDEIILTPDSDLAEKMSVRVQNEFGESIESVTINLADASVQKRYPTCMSKTDKSGKSLLEVCPTEFWLSVYHPNYGHQIKYISNPLDEVQITLRPKVESRISLEDNHQPVKAKCTLEYVFGSGDHTYSFNEKHDLKDGILVLNRYSGHVSYQLNCSSGNVEITKSFNGESIPEVIEFPHQIQRSVIVLDSFGASLPYARIVVNGREYITDESGKLSLMAQDEQKLHVYHWLHGESEVIFTNGTGELEIHLPDKASSETEQCLNKHHCFYIVDSAAILVDEAMEKYPVQRGDIVESCDDKGAVVVRDDRRMKIVW